MERELVALRRENDELRRQLQMAEDRKLLRNAQFGASGEFSDAGGSGRSASARKAPSPIVLRPQGGKREGEEPSHRSRGVDLQPLPHSAPDAELMARYESYSADQSRARGRGASSPARSGSAAEAAASSGERPRRYRLIGSRSSASKVKRGSTRGKASLSSKAPSKPGTGPSSAPSTAPAKAPKKAKLSEKSLYEKARAHYLAGERDKANEIFVVIEANYPQGSLADNAAYWQAQDHYEAGRKGAALDGFLRVLQQYPTGNKVEDSMLKIAYCYDDMGKSDDAVAMLKSLVPRAHGETKTLAQQRLERIHARRSKP